MYVFLFKHYHQMPAFPIFSSSFQCVAIHSIDVRFKNNESCSSKVESLNPEHTDIFGLFLQ